MAITKKDVSRVADLARLALTEEESGLYAVQLGRILEHVEKLSELDTKGVPPAARPAPFSA
ncbi:MAG: Asp-tRNA(Asn)/Glu-tRNA(Gln) amidotransferase subunit GatC, partial [Thermodesulfobacteriota bacterium]